MEQNQIKTHAENKDRKNEYRQLTSKHWQVYYYLMTISKYNSRTVEDHRFIYKNEVSISAIAKKLHMSRPTIYKALDNLKQAQLIKERNKEYLLFWGPSFTSIDYDLLIKLTNWGIAEKRKDSAIDLLRIYLCLKRMDTLATNDQDRCFTKRELLQILGHDVTTSENYVDITNYLALLCMYKLIELKFHTGYDERYGNFTVYHLQKVNNNTDCPDLISDINAEIKNKGVMSEAMKQKLTSQQEEILKS